MPRALLLPILVILILCFSTVLFFKYSGRYDISGPELIGDPHFNQGLARWERSGSVTLLPQTGEAVLDNASPVANVHLTQTIPDFKRGDRMAYSCDLRISNVRKGDAYWKKARVVLAFYDNSGKGMYFLPHVLVEKVGDTNWEHYERVFRVPAQAVEARASIQLPEATGNMRVRNLSLRPVTESQSFTRHRLLLIATWLAVLGWIAVYIIHFRLPVVRKPMFILTVLAVILGTLLPQQVKSVLDQRIQQVAIHANMEEQNALDGSTVAPPIHRLTLPVSAILIVYKTGHVMMFALLSFVAFVNKPQKLPVRQLVVCLLVFALSTEVLQLFIEGRESRWQDFAIDTIGIMLGAVFWKLHNVMRRQPTAT